jgi:alkylation response protein AidB-like acyl-CoA dehydrogenase
MVSFELTDEQKLMQKAAHEFAAKEIRPAAMECDRKGEIPWDVLRKAHALGLTNAMIPSRYGGGGVESILGNCVFIEELMWGCAGIATSLVGGGLAFLPIMYMGTEEQKARLLPRFCGGEPKLGALCVTEADAGSDVAAIATRAERKGGEWVINGVKRFITNGGIAEVHVVFATVDPSLKYLGLRAFAVERGNPGLRQGKVEDKMGIRSSHTAEVILEDCHVPLENQLGGETESAFYGAMMTLERTRPLVAAGRVRVRARLQQEEEGVRSPDRQEAGDRVHARGHEDEDRRREAPDMACRVEGGQQFADEQGGCGGEAVRRRHCHGGHDERGADTRRLGLHEGRARGEVDA